MKFTPFISCIALLAISSVASAVPIPVTGGADTMVAWGELSNSGAATEQQFIADYLNVDVSTLTYSQLQNSGGEDNVWQTVDGHDSLFAFDFGALAPALFLIKTGNNVSLPGQQGTFDTFLFSNVVGANWAVVDLDLFTRSRGSVEIGMISHAGMSGTSGNTSVPEPGTLSLLALGLAGVGFMRRKIR